MKPFQWIYWILYITKGASHYRNFSDILRTKQVHCQLCNDVWLFCWSVQRIHHLEHEQNLHGDLFFFTLMQTPDRTDWNFGMTGFRTLRTWLIGQCFNSRRHMSSVCYIAVIPFLSLSSWFSLWRGTSVAHAVSQSAVERSESLFCFWQRRPWM